MFFWYISFHAFVQLLEDVCQAYLELQENLTKHKVLVPKLSACVAASPCPKRSGIPTASAKCPQQQGSFAACSTSTVTELMDNMTLRAWKDPETPRARPTYATGQNGMNQRDMVKHST
jgi:hypothetical protein